MLKLWASQYMQCLSLALSHRKCLSGPRLYIRAVRKSIPVCPDRKAIRCTTTKLSQVWGTWMLLRTWEHIRLTGDDAVVLHMIGSISIPRTKECWTALDWHMRFLCNLNEHDSWNLISVRLTCRYRLWTEFLYSVPTHTSLLLKCISKSSSKYSRSAG